MFGRVLCHDEACSFNRCALVPCFSVGTVFCKSVEFFDPQVTDLCEHRP